MPVVKLTAKQETVLDRFVNEINVLNALADVKRQQIIVILCKHEKEGLTVTDITNQMEITQPAVSHHLKILREAGLVSFRKNGLQSVYYLTVSEPLKNLEEVVHALRTEIVEA
ncbi:ArsR/SmtB family transcription factor [Ligilactobacillus agilis]|nr:metalloregulator ArsR/SmtB family transcription factor [Ligilactobacillus agilis]ASR40239.1 transcriptional regulator [Ligilactobacillus agilis]MBL1055814.1 winged helix-turn-helix transcriptional regulator [Ligilactobacillus agilis]MBM6762183.1 winged helix-turn-helix transcriptional regulator [Ligilactobacillus agilis]MBM6773494.1 winged helix-turn-helix transcriptional regulator [Ligilactobacillus agilis]MDK6810364.1 metalloregulator ArsR/SmtB family transcription factor [Ligilactobacill